MRLLRAAAAAGIGALLTLAPGIAGGAAEARQAHRSDGIPLLAPVHGIDPLSDPALGLRKDRLLRSVVPGPVRSDETVTALLAPDGQPVTVTDRQRLALSGTGNYIVRELGPARAVQPLDGSVPPVLELGTVVWQGFSPGGRTLTALLTLDPGIEAHRLPVGVRIGFRDRTGAPRALGAGGVAPADGTATVALTNDSGVPLTLATGVARPTAVAQVLDRLRRAALRGTQTPPVAGAGLPRALVGTATGRGTATVTAPLEVTGTIGGAAVHGPGLTPAPGGASVHGTLSAKVTFTVDLRGGEPLQLALDARPVLDPRVLQPPAGARAWRRWAAAHPAPAAVAAATTAAVTAAATAARVDELSPYLQADTPGRDVVGFHLALAPPSAPARTPRRLTPRPGAIAAAAVAAAAIVGNAALLRRRL